MTKGFLWGYLFLFEGVVLKTWVPRLYIQCTEVLDLDPVTSVSLLERNCWKMVGLGMCPSTHLCI